MAAVMDIPIRYYVTLVRRSRRKAETVFVTDRLAVMLPDVDRQEVIGCFSESGSRDVKTLVAMPTFNGCLSRGSKSEYARRFELGESIPFEAGAPGVGVSAEALGFLPLEDHAPHFSRDEMLACSREILVDGRDLFLDWAGRLAGQYGFAGGKLVHAGEPAWMLYQDKPGSLQLAFGTPGPDWPPKVLLRADESDLVPAVARELADKLGIRRETDWEAAVAFRIQGQKVSIPRADLLKLQPAAYSVSKLVLSLRHALARVPLAEDADLAEAAIPILRIAQAAERGDVPDPELAAAEARAFLDVMERVKPFTAGASLAASLSRPLGVTRFHLAALEVTSPINSARPDLAHLGP